MDQTNKNLNNKDSIILHEKFFRQKIVPCV